MGRPPRTGRPEESTDRDALSTEHSHTGRHVPGGGAAADIAAKASRPDVTRPVLPDADTLTLACLRARPDLAGATLSTELCTACPQPGV